MSEALLMAKSRRKTIRPASPREWWKETDRIFLGEWLIALDMKAAELARNTGINEGYISQIVNNQKDNPSSKMVHALALGLGIPAKLLYEPPPTKEALRDAAKYGIELLVRLNKSMKLKA